MDKLIKFFKAIVYFATLPFSLWFWEKPKASQDVSLSKKMITTQFIGPAKAAR
jgi:hypothetical protein